ncbi:hypothetical protein [Lactiplantibacillus daowaiensis]|uniref:Extracellular protein n=1 Tax=Lactiplantibacillus daowaiensis TaxID=2559918 RepID=A0ABW1RZL6_9LACO|nr:hypothetical protein [Lactiplantibacillus daowaiensis]
MSKKWLASLAVGTALMGTGVAVGVVATQVSQPATVQAAVKTKTYKIDRAYRKDGKWYTMKVKLTYGKPVTVKTPKFKGYVAYTRGEFNLTLTANGDVQMSGNGGYYFKTISAQVQKANAKSKKAVTTNGTIYYGNAKTVSYKVKGKVGTIVSAKVPQIKGYKSNVKKMKVGINDKGKDGAWKLTKVTYKRK